MSLIQGTIEASDVDAGESRIEAMQWNGTWFYVCDASAVQGVPAENLMQVVSAVPFGATNQEHESVDSSSVDTSRDTPANTPDSTSSAPSSAPLPTNPAPEIGEAPHAKNWTRKETDFLFQLVEEMVKTENRLLTKHDFHVIKEKFDAEFVMWIVEVGEPLESRETNTEVFAKSAWVCPQRSWNALHSHATRGIKNKARYDEICKRLW